MFRAIDLQVVRSQGEDYQTDNDGVFEVMDPIPAGGCAELAIAPVR
jgi:hypothetical protein